MKRILIIAAISFFTLIATGVLTSCNKPSIQSFELSGESGFSTLKRDVSSAD